MAGRILRIRRARRAYAEPETSKKGGVPAPGRAPRSHSNTGGLSMNLTRGSLSLVIGLALLFAGPSTAAAIVQPPDVNPADFTPSQAIDNQYFPLPSGRLFVYEVTNVGFA